MSEPKVKEYQAELANAVAQLKGHLIDGASIVGVIETYLHLLQKELTQKE